MKRVLQTAAIAALVVVLIGASGYMMRSGQAQDSTPTPAATTSADRSVTVSGSGRVSARPDTAVINIGVRTEAATAEEALSQNNEQMQAVIESLEENGVAEDNIQTSSLMLNARYDEPRINSDGPELVGYTAENMVRIRISDLDNLGEVLDAAVQAGGNQIHGINFEISDATELQVQAREAAVENARAKAEQLAEATNAELGEVLTISEVSQSPGPVMRAEFAHADTAASVPIEAGTQDVEVQVQVTWRLQ